MKRSDKSKLIKIFFATVGATLLIGMVCVLVVYGVQNSVRRSGKITYETASAPEADDGKKTDDSKKKAAGGRVTESLDDIPNAGKPAESSASGSGAEGEAAATEEEPAEEIDTSANSYIHSGVVERFGDDLDNPEYLAANKIYVMESRDDDPECASLTFAGDILFDDEYSVMSKLIRNGGEINAGIDISLINKMKSSDIMMVNNEFPYSYGGSPTEGKTYTFRADPPTVRYITDMGANAVGIANNHAFDFGETAFMDTLTTLEEAGIPYTGGGRNIEEASAPLYFVVDDVKIGIIAATQIERLDHPDTRGATDTQSGVFRCLNPDRLLAKIGEMRPKCDFLVVFIHWGTESTTEIDWIQQDQAPKIAEAGADIIVGAHPHVLQPIGTSKGVPVIYSLGNFWFNSKTLDTGMIRMDVTSEGMKDLQFIPCRQEGGKTHMSAGEERDRILAEMRAMSPGVSIDGEGYITY